MKLRIKDGRTDGLKPIERILPLLEKVRPRSEGGWTACCPAHDDRHPSMSVSEASDGRVLLCCHKGCGFGEIMTALGLEEGVAFPDDDPQPLSPASSIARKVRELYYNYTDAEGQLLFQTVRQEFSDGSKTFRQRRPDGKGGWLWALGDVHRVLYRMPEIIHSEPSETVYVCEGEKDVETLRSLGLIATCNPMGAGKWQEEYSLLLHGRQVAVLADNDNTGREHARQVCASLTGRASSVRLVEFPGLLEKGDVTDWIEGGGNRTQLELMVAVAQDWQPATSDTSATSDEQDLQSKRYTLHHISEAMGPLKEIDWVVDALFSRGSVSVVVGPPGSKKTYSLLDLALCVANGSDWLERFVSQGSVLLIDEESGALRLQKRLQEVVRAQSFDGTTLPVYYTTMELWNLLDKGDVQEMDNLFAEVEPVLVVMDALADLMPGGDENTVKDTHPVFQRLRWLAEKHQCAIIVIHHSNRQGKYRGSTAIMGAVDLMLMVESEKDSTTIKFSTEKARDTEPQTFAAQIIFNEVDHSARLICTEAPKRLARFSQSECYVINWLKAHDNRDWVVNIKNNAEANGCAPATAERAIYRLQERGYLARCNDGKPGERAMVELRAEV